jgi:hypothetical protein
VLYFGTSAALFVNNRQHSEVTRAVIDLFD